MHPIFQPFSARVQKCHFTESLMTETSVTVQRRGHKLVGFTKFTQLCVVTSQFVMAWVNALRARIEDRTGSRHDFVEVNSLL